MTDLFMMNEQVECDCHEHHIRVRVWDEFALVEVAVLASAQYAHWTSFWRRLWMAWQVLWNGAVAVHDVLLPADKAKALGECLRDAAELAADAAEKEDK